MEFFGVGSPWLWVVGGLVLMALEIAAPGNVLIWFGLAALATGGLAFLTDLSWQADALIFVALAVAFVLAGRRYFAKGRGGESSEPLLNQRANALVGRSFVLTEPIVTGQGRIRVDDTTWRISGPDLPTGTRVTVTSVEGALLVVACA